MSRHTRTIRYGGSVLLVLVGIVCGIAIPGAAGGTVATVVVGLGLIGLVSLVFYEVGLTEDRDRARSEQARDAPPGTRDPDRSATSPRPGSRAPGESHGGARRRPTDRVRDHRRRLR